MQAIILTSFPKPPMREDILINFTPQETRVAVMYLGAKSLTCSAVIRPRAY